MNTSASKSIIVLVVLLFSLFFLQDQSFAQSSFEGKIIYSISYTDLPAEMKGYESMLPQDIKIHLKGNRSRVEQSQMMGTNVVVSDMDERKGFLEMDVNGQKLRVSISTEKFNEQAAGITNFEYMDDTKTIAGYPCKKAVVKDESGTTIMTIFYTEKIQNKAQMEFVGLKGFPLEYSMAQQNIKMMMTASVITEESVPDQLFEPSEGYKDISEADLKQMMGGFGN